MFIIDQDGDLISLSDCTTIYCCASPPGNGDVGAEHCIEAIFKKSTLVKGVPSHTLFKGTEEDCLEYRFKLLDWLERNHLLFR